MLFPLHLWPAHVCLHQPTHPSSRLALSSPFQTPCRADGLLSTFVWCLPGSWACPLSMFLLDFIFTWMVASMPSSVPNSSLKTCSWLFNTCWSVVFVVLNWCFHLALCPFLGFFFFISLQSNPISSSQLRPSKQGRSPPTTRRGNFFLCSWWFCPHWYLCLFFLFLNH